MGKSAPDPVDRYVGKRIKMRRLMLKISQAKLGAALGLSFQQIQKYERGRNRVSPARIHRLSEILQVPPEFFFGGIDEGNKSNPVGASHFASDFLSTQEGLALIQAFLRVKSPTIRKAIVALVDDLANSDL